MERTAARRGHAPGMSRSEKRAPALLQMEHGDIASSHAHSETSPRMFVSPLAGLPSSAAKASARSEGGALQWDRDCDDSNHRGAGQHAATSPTHIGHLSLVARQSPADGGRNKQKIANQRKAHRKLKYSDRFSHFHIVYRYNPL